MSCRSSWTRVYTFLPIYVTWGHSFKITSHFDRHILPFANLYPWGGWSSEPTYSWRHSDLFLHLITFVVLPNTNFYGMFAIPLGRIYTNVTRQHDEDAHTTHLIFFFFLFKKPSWIAFLPTSCSGQKRWARKR